MRVRKKATQLFVLLDHPFQKAKWQKKPLRMSGQLGEIELAIECFCRVVLYAFFLVPRVLVNLRTT